MAALAKNDIPEFVKHVAMAIYESGDLSGSNAKKFESSLNIARSRLVQYGYLMPGSQNGPVERIRLTSAGARKNAQHKTEGAAGLRKSKMFDSLLVDFSETDSRAKAVEQKEEVCAQSQGPEVEAPAAGPGASRDRREKRLAEKKEKEAKMVARLEKQQRARKR